MAYICLKTKMKHSQVVTLCISTKFRYEHDHVLWNTEGTGTAYDPLDDSTSEVNASPPLWKALLHQKIAEVQLPQ